MNKIRSVVLVTVVLLISILISACDNSTSEQVKATINSKDSIESTLSTESNDTYDIATPLVDIKYPEKWKKTTDVNVKTEGEVTTIEFIAKINKKNYHIFDLIFGGNEGQILGTYIKDGKEMPVFVKSYDVVSDNMPEEVKYEIMKRDEDINVIIDNLKKSGNLVI